MERFTVYNRCKDGLAAVSESKRTTITVFVIGERSMRIDIKHNYGDYRDTDEHGREVVRNNTGYETLYSHTKDMLYALRRGRTHWSRYF